MILFNYEGKSSNKLPRHLFLFLIFLSLSFQVFGQDNSTPRDGNLYIESSTPFTPRKMMVYSDKSILKRKNIIFRDNRIFISADSIPGDSNTAKRNRTLNSDVAWIDDKTYVVLTGNSTIYPHDILGDNIESTGFEIYKNNRLLNRYELSKGRVFETLRPLIADIIPENIGKEIILTSSSRTDGSRVEVYSQAGKLLAASQAIGRRFRWLHILGFATFNDSGKYLAIVKTPHLGGVLEFLYWNGRELKVKASFHNVSTHKIGSDNLNMALLIKGNGINKIEIIVPSMDFRSLLFIQFKQNKLIEVNRIELPTPLSTNLFYDNSDSPSIWFGLSNGDFVNIY